MFPHWHWNWCSRNKRKHYDGDDDSKSQEQMVIIVGNDRSEADSAEADSIILNGVTVNQCLEWTPQEVRDQCCEFMICDLSDMVIEFVGSALAELRRKSEEWIEFDVPILFPLDPGRLLGSADDWYYQPSCHTYNDYGKILKRFSDWLVRRYQICYLSVDQWHPNDHMGLSITGRVLGITKHDGRWRSATEIQSGMASLSIIRVQKGESKHWLQVGFVFTHLTFPPPSLPPSRSAAYCTIM